MNSSDFISKESLQRVCRHRRIEGLGNVHFSRNLGFYLVYGVGIAGREDFYLIFLITS